MTNEELTRRMFALEAFVYGIGSAVFQQSPPEIQDALQDLQDRWNDERRKISVDNGGQGDE